MTKEQAMMLKEGDVVLEVDCFGNISTLEVGERDLRIIPMFPTLFFLPSDYKSAEKRAEQKHYQYSEWLMDMWCGTVY